MVCMVQDIIQYENGANMKHTFVICAYNESPFLEDCIKSLKRQRVKSYIKIATSTPNKYISNIAEKYNIEVFENGLKTECDISNIGRDWQFAYNIAKTDMVTIAHQDDYYLKDYVSDLLKYKKKYPDMMLFTTSSITLKNNKLIPLGKVEIVKKLLRLPLRCNLLNHLKFIKKMAITFGNPIIAPSCTYDKRLCPKDLFLSKFKFVIDWECLLRLSALNGRFVLSEKPGICYRIHDGATTKKSILDNTRQEEESLMFEKLLPRSIAGLYKKLYKNAYNAYD